MPPGVINFIPAPGRVTGDTLTASPDLAAINFTGSTETFGKLWKQGAPGRFGAPRQQGGVKRKSHPPWRWRPLSLAVGVNLTQYHTYPRLVGECGGKNFHVVHPSAEVETVVNETLRSAFEYQGQKCSACSRLYVPRSLWCANTFFPGRLCSGCR